MGNFHCRICNLSVAYNAKQLYVKIFVVCLDLNVAAVIKTEIIQLCASFEVISENLLDTACRKSSCGSADNQSCGDQDSDKLFAEFLFLGFVFASVCIFSIVNTHKYLSFYFINVDIRHFGCGNVNIHKLVVELVKNCFECSFHST